VTRNGYAPPARSRASGQQCSARARPTPSLGGDSGGVQCVEVGIERLQRPRPVRAAKADDEAARVIALQGSYVADDVGGGYRSTG